MYKSKRRKILKNIYSNVKNRIKKINKTIKNKPSLKKCDQFCKNDYIVEMNKVFKKSAEKYNLPYTPPTKEEQNFAFNTCKKTFCNEKCDGYDFNGNKQQQLEFQKKIKNGFQNSYSKDKVNMLQKRGALSGCVDIIDYDVYHKSMLP